MSFILDALKKSEREREQQQAPTTAHTAYGRQPRQQPVWMIAVICLLAINLGVLATMWLRSSPPQTAPTQITVNNLPASTAPVTPNVMAPTTNNEVRSLAGEALAGEGLTGEALSGEANTATSNEDRTAAVLANAPVPEGPQLVRSIPGGAIAAPVAAAAEASQQTSNDGVPTLDSLGGAAVLNLPALHLDIHVYAENPAGRFVFINQHKYTEGQALKEGPLLERISRDGVILSYKNQRFQLARQ